MSRALIVVHPSMDYLSDLSSGCEYAKNTKGVFDRIAQFASTYDGAKILIEGADPREFPTYERIEDLFSHHEIVHSSTHATQFLQAKEMLGYLGIDAVDVCGVTYTCCVRCVSDLLQGIENDEIGKERYAEAADEDLGFESEGFEALFSRRYNVRILDDLTDKDSPK